MQLFRSREQRLGSFVKQREGYLSTFHKIISDLTGLNDKIEKEKTTIDKDTEKQQKVIVEAKLKIEDCRKGIVFLNDQKEINQAQIEKIRALVEPTTSKSNTKKKDTK